MSTINSQVSAEDIKELCDQILKYNYINPDDFNRFNVKRGLRNSDGTGVMAGISRVCSVEGYYISDGERIPKDGRLTFRGISMEDIVRGCMAENRFGFEEIVWLLLFGSLPTQKQLSAFCKLLSRCRELPDNFAEDMIMKAPSPDIMNKLARSVLALYSYDENPDDTTLENVLRQCISIIAQAVLGSIRADKTFTDEEAKLLDTCLMVHAEHGGGNNSTFATRVLTSSGTDTYSAIAAGIGALKGPKHGGANIKVAQMVDFIRNDVADINDEGQVADYLRKIIQKEGGDRSGLIYGMGHAVYTISDPRAKILREQAGKFAAGTEFEEEFHLLNSIEKLTPAIFAEFKGERKNICANVDLYSGLVYKMLRIPPDLFTPIFTIARVAGWSAHRIEELLTGGRIIRPAYKNINTAGLYVPITER